MDRRLNEVNWVTTYFSVVLLMAVLCGILMILELLKYHEVVAVVAMDNSCDVVAVCLQGRWSGIRYICKVIQ